MGKDPARSASSPSPVRTWTSTSTQGLFGGRSQSSSHGSFSYATSVGPLVSPTSLSTTIGVGVAVTFAMAHLPKRVGTYSAPEYCERTAAVPSRLDGFRMDRSRGSIAMTEPDPAVTAPDYLLDNRAAEAEQRFDSLSAVLKWMERVTRIELAFSAWEADVLPLNYTRATAEAV